MDIEPDTLTRIFNEIKVQTEILTETRIEVGIIKETLPLKLGEVAVTKIIDERCGNCAKKKETKPTDWTKVTWIVTKALSPLILAAAAYLAVT